MRYIIMADGRGTRWRDYDGTPKHLVTFGGETLLARTARLARSFDPDAEVIITSHDPSYETPGTTRHEPEHNVLEIDRFTRELIEDGVCFLYGDTFYADGDMKTIVEEPAEALKFFGMRRSIVAVKVRDGSLFRRCVERVRQRFLAGELDRCIGWDVYNEYAGMPDGGRVPGRDFVRVSEETKNINTPNDYLRKKRALEAGF